MGNKLEFGHHIWKNYAGLVEILRSMLNPNPQARPTMC